MPASIDKLLKYFQLEKENNYPNRVIIGGMDKMLGPWIFEARKENVPDALIQSVKTTIENYGSIPAEARKSLLDELIQEINRVYVTLPEKSKPQDAESQNLPQNKPNQEQLANHKLQSNTPTAAVSAQSPVRGEGHKPGARKPPEKRPVQPQITESLGLDAPVTVIRGIGPSQAKLYENIGVRSLKDVLYYFPRRYDDYSQLKPINRVNIGDELTVIATVQSCSIVVQKHTHTTRIEVVVSDGTDFLRLIFFRRGEDIGQYYENRFRHGAQFVISGKVSAYLGRKQMQEPEVESLEKTHLNTNGIIPVYPLTANLSQNSVRNTIHQVITHYAPRVPDFLPEEIRKSANLIDLPVALQNIHYPANHDILHSSIDRLAFDEIFLLQLGVLQQKQSWQSLSAPVITTDQAMLDSFYSTLPYQLTNAQQNAIAQILADLSSSHPMNRLLQGDVGSGKTIVAATAMLTVAISGGQSALMAPTSILAEQHYRSLAKILANPDLHSNLQPDQIALLTGDTTDADRKVILQGLADGNIKVIVGTHALIEDKVAFKELQFVIIDEQHRFGVAQRAALRQKGDTPHLLVMTATPIPRSLALTLYGDLDLSLMDEMPAGRIPVETHVLSPLERERAYHLIRSQVSAGYQAFIVYPLIENTDADNEIKAAVNEHDQLQKEIFPDLRIGLLHGRMKPDEKDKIMRQFRDKEFHILVSTTVIEVGVDIPNATVMLVEGADHFGLAQLHQLRGRVGRSDQLSFCLLIPTSDNATENERLSAMEETNDGFILAEKDLAQRGPGDFIGIRQSGYPDLQLANITDIRLIEKARTQAEKIFKIDPDLALPDNQLLAEKLKQFWLENTSDIS